MNTILTGAMLVVMFSPIDEGRVRWTPGFPMSLPGTGAALINGRIRPRPGFVATSAKVAYWQDGTVVYKQTVTIGPNGKLGPTFITGLTRGKEYNVMLEVVQVGQGQQQTLANISRISVR